MSLWQNFLNSLSTRGGAIFLLSMVFTSGMIVVVHLIHHNETDSMFAGMILSTFSSFSGALLLALKGSSESSASASAGPGGPVVTASTAPAPTPSPEVK